VQRHVVKTTGLLFQCFVSRVVVDQADDSVYWPGGSRQSRRDRLEGAARTCTH